MLCFDWKNEMKFQGKNSEFRTIFKFKDQRFEAIWKILIFGWNFVKFF